jgi:hypothetical protein
MQMGGQILPHLNMGELLSHQALLGVSDKEASLTIGPLLQA